MGKCIRAPHPNTLPYTSPFISPHTSLSHHHTFPFTPYTFPHFSTHHTSFLTHPHTPTHFPTPPPHLFPQLPSPPPTPQLTSPLTPCTLPQIHIFPQSLDYVTKLPCDDVTLINLNGLWKSPIKFSTTTGNLKSCFGVGNVNFR